MLFRVFGVCFVLSRTKKKESPDSRVREQISQNACSSKVAFAKKRNSIFKIESAVAKLGAGSGPCVRLQNEDLEA